MAKRKKKADSVRDIPISDIPDVVYPVISSMVSATETTGLFPADSLGIISDIDSGAFPAESQKKKKY
jgi:hypothetical protein